MHTAVTVKVATLTKDSVDYYTVNVIKGGFVIIGERTFRQWETGGTTAKLDHLNYIDGLRQAYVSMGVECDIQYP